MGRKEIDRMVSQPPLFNEFKPAGYAGKHLKTVSLSIDEYEAIRLIDYKAFTHEEAADEMGISRPVFTKLLEKARYKFSQFLVEGIFLKIEGGNIHFRKNIIKCSNCGQMFEIDMDHQINICPNCNSETIINIAGGYGHGKCCVNNHRRQKCQD